MNRKRFWLINGLILGLGLLAFSVYADSSQNGSINGPTDFNPGKFERRTKNWVGDDSAKGIKWVVPLGNTTYNQAVLSDHFVMIATNNGNAYLEKYPETVDLGCLLAFDRKTGEFCWQYSAEKLQNTDHDWPLQGLCSKPVVDNKEQNVWFVNNRSEVVCLSIDQRSVVDSEPKIVWTFDMMKEVGSLPHQMACCNPIIVDHFLLTGTSNGVAMNDKDIPAPKSPNCIALDKKTGKIIWSDLDQFCDQIPDSKLLDGQWSSPILIPSNNNVPFDQIVYPCGDGWIYVYRIDNQSLIPFWKFDANPKTSFWKGNGQGTRNIIMATPVYSEEQSLLYLTTGQDPEAGEGEAVFWAIDVQKATDLAVQALKKTASTENKNSAESLDVSETLVVDSQSNPVEPQRYLACDSSLGQKEIPNPNSAVSWKYQGLNPVSDDFEDVFHRTLGTPTIVNHMIFIGDFSGLIHCLDAQTGNCYWVYDSMATIWASPMSVGNIVYLGNTDGDLYLFNAETTEMNLIETVNMGAPIYAAPTWDALNQTLFIPTNRYLFAIDPEKEARE